LFSNARDEILSELWDRVENITPENADNSAAVRPVGSFDRRYLHGPFDIVGDVHGCLDELSELLSKLGYVFESTGSLAHPDGRTLVFLGDLADRGPKSAEVFAMVISLVEEGVALYTPGNHCNKLLRYLKGNKVSVGNGLEGTIESLAAREQTEEGFTARVRQFIAGAPPYLWLDGGSLVVAHGGIKEEMIGKDDSKVRAMVLYGDVTGKPNPDGTPERLDWA